MFFFLPQKSVFAPGFSGIPGSNGIPGMPGIPGAPSHPISIYFSSFQKSIFCSRFPRIPGSNGIPGMPGIPNAPGLQRQQGKMELRGSLVSRDRCDRGAPGMTGLKGDKC